MAHGAQAAPPVEYCPAAHALQDDAPVAVVVVPSLHAVHTVDAVDGAYLPTAQATQADDDELTAYCPSTHAIQLAAPVPPAFPGEQGKHVDMPVTFAN